MFGMLELLVFKNAAGFNAAVAACSKQSWRAALGLLSLPRAVPDTVPWLDLRAEASSQLMAG